MMLLSFTLRLCLLTGVTDVGPSPAFSPDSQAKPEATAATLPEVRLRKLHLVRPDLIPYPIAYEVFC